MKWCPCLRRYEAISQSAQLYYQTKMEDAAAGWPPEPVLIKKILKARKEKHHGSDVFF